MNPALRNLLSEHRADPRVRHRLRDRVAGDAPLVQTLTNAVEDDLEILEEPLWPTR